MLHVAIHGYFRTIMLTLSYLFRRMPRLKCMTLSDKVIRDNTAILKLFTNILNNNKNIMFEIEYEFREDDLVYFNELQLQRSAEIQGNIRKNRLIVPGIMLLIGAYYYFYFGDMLTAGYISAIAVLWAVFSPRVMRLDFQRQILSKYTAKEKAEMFGTYHLSLDKDYLIEKSPSGKHKMAWGELVRVEYVPKYVFIYIDLSTALVIPVATVTKGNLEQFAEQVEKMIAKAE